jgi:hypothetical protein
VSAGPYRLEGTPANSVVMIDPVMSFGYSRRRLMLTMVKERGRDRQTERLACEQEPLAGIARIPADGDQIQSMP